MADKETVINALERCAAAECDERCGYNDVNYGCKPELMLDAASLLKEQRWHQFRERALDVEEKNNAESGGIRMSENRCVACGEIIPEGGQVCQACMARAIRQQEKQELKITIAFDWVFPLFWIVLFVFGIVYAVKYG